MIDRISELRDEARAAIAAASSSDELEQLRVRWLGRKAELPQLLRGVAELPADQRGAVGKAANEARQDLEALIDERHSQLGAAELEQTLSSDRIDVPLRGAPLQPRGTLPLLTSPRRELEDIFLGLGFTI